MQSSYTTIEQAEVRFVIRFDRLEVASFFRLARNLAGDRRMVTEYPTQRP